MLAKILKIGLALVAALIVVFAMCLVKAASVAEEEEDLDEYWI